MGRQKTGQGKDVKMYFRKNVWNIIKNHPHYQSYINNLIEKRTEEILEAEKTIAYNMALTKQSKTNYNGNISSTIAFSHDDFYLLTAEIKSGKSKCLSEAVHKVIGFYREALENRRRKKKNLVIKK